MLSILARYRPSLRRWNVGTLYPRSFRELLAIYNKYNHRHVKVVGYNDTAAEPVRCLTKSFKFRTGQMEFYCHGFWAGTSGSPWIIGYNAKTGGGTVFGVIGGYEEGGDYEWASYSAYFGTALRNLFVAAEKQQVPPPPPPTTPPPSPSASAS